MRVIISLILVFSFLTVQIVTDFNSGVNNYAYAQCDPAVDPECAGGEAPEQTCGRTGKSCSEETCKNPIDTCTQVSITVDNRNISTCACCPSDPACSTPTPPGPCVDDPNKPKVCEGSSFTYCCEENKNCCTGSTKDKSFCCDPTTGFCCEGRGCCTLGAGSTCCPDSDNAPICCGSQAPVCCGRGCCNKGTTCCLDEYGNAKCCSEYDGGCCKTKAGLCWRNVRCPDNPCGTDRMEVGRGNFGCKYFGPGNVGCEPLSDEEIIENFKKRTGSNQISDDARKRIIENSKCNRCARSKEGEEGCTCCQ